MKGKGFRYTFSAVVMMFTLALCGAEIKLTENGKSVSCIVLRKNAGVVEKHAAKELSVFLGKISGGAAPVIGLEPVKRKYPIYLELTLDKRVGEEGFRISADKKALRIAGKEPVGVLYGVYEVLKKDGGIRWLLPGEDGETHHYRQRGRKDQESGFCKKRYYPCFHALELSYLGILGLGSTQQYAFPCFPGGGAYAEKI